jgi:hypothetical protein
MSGGLPENHLAIELDTSDLYQGDFASLVEMGCDAGDWSKQQTWLEPHKVSKSHSPPIFTAADFHEIHRNQEQRFDVTQSRSQFIANPGHSILGTSSNPINLVDAPPRQETLKTFPYAASSLREPQVDKNHRVNRFNDVSRWQSQLTANPSTIGTSSNPIYLVDSPPPSPPSQRHPSRSIHDENPTSTPNPAIPGHEFDGKSAEEIEDLLSNIRPDEDIKVENENGIIPGLAENTKLMRHQQVFPSLST